MGYIHNGREGFWFVLKLKNEVLDSHISDFRGFIAVVRERLSMYDDIIFIIDDIQNNDSVRLEGSIRLEEEVIIFGDPTVYFRENGEDMPGLQLKSISLDLKTSTLMHKEVFYEHLPEIQFERNVKVKRAAKR